MIRAVPEERLNPPARASFPVLCMLAVLTGCHQPIPPTELTQSVAQIDNDDQFEALWDACQDVLRGHRFHIDRHDRRAGIITTYPETSQHVLEFWRHDVDTPYDLADSTLHTIRRTVTIQLSRPESQPDCTVDVTVNKERYHAAERQINNAAAALRIFSADLPTTTGLPYDLEAHTYWTPDGRDAAMEQRLLDLILARS